MNGPRVLLLGWDAADWKVIRPLLADGSMPNLARFLAEGVHGNQSTLYPMLSPMLWTSIATGKRPHKHGVLGFSEPTPSGQAVRPVSILSRKTKAIWNILAQEKMRSVVVGWWPSFPAEPIPGAMVSNQFQHVPDDPEAPLPRLMPDTVYPAAVGERMADLRVRPWEIPGEVLRVFVPRFDEVDQEQDKSLHDLAKILSETLSIHAAATDLLERESWDFAAVYFDAIDHAGHRFMPYHPPCRPNTPEKEFALYREIITHMYRQHDAMLGRYLEIAGNEAHVLVVSDHGFHSAAMRPAWIPAEPAGPAVEHRHFGIFAMKGPGIRRGERIFGTSLLDVCPTILTVFGLPVGEDMDGQPQLQAWETPPEDRRIPSWDHVPGADGCHPPDAVQDSRTSTAALEQMIALGYIAPPPDDAVAAVREASRELDYNLARSLTDAGRPNEAVPLLERLWADWPKEHRFGLHLLQDLARCGRIQERRIHLEMLTIRATTYSVEAKAALDALPKEEKEMDALDRHSPKFRRKQFERRALLELSAGLPLSLQREEIKQYLLEDNKVEASRLLNELMLGRELSYHLGQFVAETFVALERDDEALPLIGHLIAVEPENPSLEALRAEILYRKKDWNALVDTSAQALGLIYHNPRLHTLLGLALMQLGEYEHSRNELMVAVRQNPNQVVALDALIPLVRADPDQTLHFQMIRERVKNAARTFHASRREVPPPPAIHSYDFHDLCLTPPKPTREHLDEIIVVSGLPRSGTSMVMRALEAGGIPLLVDNERPADENNRLGYFEFTPVKNTTRDNSWTAGAAGKAVKVVAPLLKDLPLHLPCAILVMHRPMDQIIASQEAMKTRQGTNQRQTDLAALSNRYVSWMQRLPTLESARPNWRFLHLSYEAMLDHPSAECARLAQFLGQRLDSQRAANAVDPAQRRFA